MQAYSTGNDIRNDDRRRTRKHNQPETTYVRRHEKGRVGNIAETKERRSRPASSRGISLPERYDLARHLGAEDDRGYGSGDEGKP